MNFPYQIVAFVDAQPQIGDFVYHGPKGWLPHFAIKRRFDFDGNDQELLIKLSEIIGSIKPFYIEFGQVIKPRHMPVKVIEIKPSTALSQIHGLLFKELDQSKHPDREGFNYFPHMTIEWKGKRIVDPAKFVDTKQKIAEIWVLKDDGDDSRLIASYKL